MAQARSGCDSNRGPSDQSKHSSHLFAHKSPQLLSSLTDNDHFVCYFMLTVIWCKLQSILPLLELESKVWSISISPCLLSGTAASVHRQVPALMSSIWLDHLHHSILNFLTSCHSSKFCERKLHWFTRFIINQQQDWLDYFFLLSDVDFSYFFLYKYSNIVQLSFILFLTFSEINPAFNALRNHIWSSEFICNHPSSHTCNHLSSFWDWLILWLVDYILFC